MVANASQSLFVIRFDQYWNGDLNDPEMKLEMIPTNYEQLKQDQEYLYFLKSLKNQHDWYMTRPMEQVRNSMINCIELIEQELSKEE